MVLHPPPVYMQGPLLWCMEINKKADVVACHPPRGVPLRQLIFKFCIPGNALACKPTQMINQGIFCLRQKIILPRDKSRVKTPSAERLSSWRVGQRQLLSTSHVGNEDGARSSSAAVVGGDNDNNITISHTRGGGRSRDTAVAKAREVRPSKHGECRNRTRKRRGGEGVVKIGGPLK